MDSTPIAVVTGASSGIGAATARRLAAEGFHVVAAARRTDRLAEVVDAITAAGGQATAVPCDVTVDADVAQLQARVRQLGGPVTVLVNNAGLALGLDPVESGVVAHWQRMFEV
ncbi:MAG: SDR family oxidoreductase, partial [Micromonosporaceae bacterium]